jgi:DNA-binding HxlR family transcriptional regulator
MMKINTQHPSITTPHPRVGRVVETVVGCKWSLTVLDLVAQGIVRPGAMERSTAGLSAKVLNSCLRRLVTYQLLTKRSYPEIPPRVEYALTEFGVKLRHTLAALNALEAELEEVAETDG